MKYTCNNIHSHMQVDMAHKERNAGHCSSSNSFWIVAIRSNN